MSVVQGESVEEFGFGVVAVPDSKGHLREAREQIEHLFEVEAHARVVLLFCRRSLRGESRRRLRRVKGEGAPARSGHDAEHAHLQASAYHFGRRVEKLVETIGLLPAFAQKTCIEDADHPLVRVAPETQEHQVEGDPFEGLREVTAEGLLVKPGEARHVGEVDPPAHSQDYAKEFGEKVAPALSNRIVVDLGYPCEDQKRARTRESFVQAQVAGSVCLVMQHTSAAYVFFSNHAHYCTDC